MSWLPKDLYPPGSGIDSKLIEDIVMGDIIKHEIRRSEQVAAILTKVMFVAQQEDDASSSYEYYDEEEEEYEEADYDQNEQDYEQEFEEDYDDDEEDEEEEESESEEESEYDTNEWASLFLLVNGMPTENEESKSLTRKRSSTYDEASCPPPQAPAAKRQRMEPSIASRVVRTQDTETKEMDMPSSVPSEWLSAPQPNLRNSQLPAPLRTLLQGTPISELHQEAQAFLLALDYLAPGANDMGKAAIDMGIRFSKTARKNEYSIVLKHMLNSPLQAVMYNACRDEEAQHILFWEKVQSVTGRDIPPERIKDRRERCEKRKAEFLAISRARQAEEEAKKKTYQNLKERFVKQIGEATKLPLDEKVSKWLSEIVPVQRK
ncbi:hypothetical protein KAF25_010487 [Fusarium avenaceum]|uniref:Uncharacterized protein n=1 Tax=Fusarium avenaceum TaxID=40199 RepID=A0A9P7KTD7_9HYPO|nr:hypothetical protein KAF25_010487 [Fusarium avenaceum]